MSWDWKTIYLMAVNLNLIFFVSECSKAWFIGHPTNVILFSSIWLFLDMATSLTFLNVILNGLKQNTFNGLKTCDVWDGGVIMFKLIYCVCDIVYKVTWLPCPFRISKCLLLKETPLETNFLTKENNSLNKKKVIHAFMHFFALPCKSLVCKV